MRNEGYAGILGVPIIGLRISGGKKYQVHTFRNGWLDEVTGNNISDFDFGFAGNYTNIDAVAISGVQRYQVHYLKGNWLPHKSKYNKYSEDGYAGHLGYPIDAIMIKGRTYAVCINDSTIESKPNYFISITREEFKYEIARNIEKYINFNKIIIGSDFTAIVSYSDDINPKEEIDIGKSSIDLGNCTQIIKNYYNMSKDEKLIIVNMEEKYNRSRENKYEENSSLDLGKNIQIEVYDISGKQLDVSVCKEEIKLIKYIGDVEELDFQSAESLSERGIDVFNINDKFFNDICHPNRIENKDIILKDRASDIYQNVILCQEGCVYNDINYYLMIVNCKCNSSMLQIGIDNKTNFNNNNDALEKIDLNWIKKLLKSSIEQINFNVIPCINLAFDKKILLKNIGFYCMCIMLIFQLILLFVYSIKKLKSLKNFMFSFANKTFNINPLINNKKFSSIKNKNHLDYLIKNGRNCENNFLQNDKSDRKSLININ